MKNLSLPWLSSWDECGEVLRAGGKHLDVHEPMDGELDWTMSDYSLTFTIIIAPEATALCLIPCRTAICTQAVEAVAYRL